MLKGYIQKIEQKKKSPEIDYEFTSKIDLGWTWPTREEAEFDCLRFNRGIYIDSALGGKHKCDGFTVEGRRTGEFVVSCFAPFIPAISRLESAD